MNAQHKMRAGLLAGLASLAAIVGGASIATGETPSPQTAPASSAGTDTVQQEGGRPDRDGHLCPEEEGGQNDGSSPEQAAPQAPTAPTTATPDV